MVKHVVKRDGRVVIFDNRKIVDAILKAMDVTEDGEDIVLAAEIAATSPEAPPPTMITSNSLSFLAVTIMLQS